MCKQVDGERYQLSLRTNENISAYDCTKDLPISMKTNTWAVDTKVPKMLDVTQRPMLANHIIQIIMLY